jgi:TonB family protein
MLCISLLTLLLATTTTSCQLRRDRPPGNEPTQESMEDALEELILETDFIEGEQVQTLPSDPVAATAGRPCAWSSLWSRPQEPNPLLAGVGGVEMPSKVADAEIRLPIDPSRGGEEIVVKIVIGADGAVREATILRSPKSQWAEAEGTVLTAVKQWRYEPPRFEGTPVSVCSTIFVRL